jgi:hypothetical protein
MAGQVCGMKETMNGCIYLVGKLLKNIEFEDRTKNGRAVY